MSFTLKSMVKIILLILYKLRDEMTDFVNINKIFQYVEKEGNSRIHEFSELKEFVGYLEAKGYVKVKYVVGGVFVKLTTPGRFEVEESENNNNENGINETAQSIYEKITADSISGLKDTQENIIELRKPLYNLLENIKENIKKNASDKSSLYIDAEIINLELKKLEPDSDVLVTKILALQDAHFISNELTQFTDQLGIDVSSPHVIDGGIF